MKNTLINMKPYSSQKEHIAASLRESSIEQKKDISEYYKNDEYNENSYNDSTSNLLNLYIDLLNCSEKYMIKELKNDVECGIVNDGLVLPQNVIELGKWAKMYSAEQLREYCERYMINN